MPARNDVTGDSIVSKSSNNYRDNYDRIFGRAGRKREEEPTPEVTVNDNALNSLTDDLQKQVDGLVQTCIEKEACLLSHCENVKKIFSQLYPDTEITDEQIRLITLMWEEQMKEKT